MIRFSRMIRAAAIYLIASLASLGSAQQVNSADVAIETDHANGTYHTGDPIHFIIEWKGQGSAPTDARYTLKSGGLTKMGGGDLKFEQNKATVDTKLDQPNTVLISVTWAGSVDPKHLSCGGAVADPDQIKPAAECPADFDVFWKSKLDELAKIPANPKIESAESGAPGVQYFKVTLDNINSTHVQGQLARPDKGDKFPAILVLQWAGVYGLDKNWVNGFASQGWLAMNIEAHDIPIDKDPSFYKQLYDGPLKNYWMLGNEDRDKSYYLQMYGACVQALHYLKSRPDWDGKTIVLTGQSQGGQQTLALAGLCPDEVSAAITLVPAACDMLAPNVGRASGFPVWWNQTWGGRDADKVHETSRYFDPINFAMRIKCPVLVAYGLHDDLAPPSSVLAAVNEIKSPKEVLCLPLSGHMGENDTQKPYYNRMYGAWLPALAHGEKTPAEKN
jgi:cephalosporin-C deacetylase